MSYDGKGYDLNSGLFIPKNFWLKNLWPKNFWREKVGAVATGFFDGRGAAPFGDLGMIPADEHFWDLPAAVFGGPGVVRVVEEEVTSGER